MQKPSVEKGNEPDSLWFGSSCAVCASIYSGLAWRKCQPSAHSSPRGPRMDVGSGDAFHNPIALLPSCKSMPKIQQNATPPPAQVQPVTRYLLFHVFDLITGQIGNPLLPRGGGGAAFAQSTNKSAKLFPQNHIPWSSVQSSARTGEGKPFLFLVF